MFIISITYKVDLEKVDKELNNHVRFLENQYATGNFIASGRKIPRTGGIILSQAKDKTEIEKIIQDDPFYKQNLADYEVIEFIPTMTSEEFKNLIEK